MCEKIYSGLRSAWPHFSYTPQLTRVLFVKSLLMPHLEYCSVVYSYGLSAVSRGLLDRAFAAMVRFAYGVKKFDSIRNFTDRLLGFDLESYFRIRAMCFVFKLIRSRTPSYLDFVNESGYSSKTNQLIVPRFYTRQCKGVLMAKGIVDWNSLPNATRSLNSYVSFRDRCTLFKFGPS